MVLVLRNGMRGGTRAAWATGLGCCTGIAVHATAAVLGLSVLLATSTGSPAPCWSRWASESPSTDPEQTRCPQGTERHVAPSQQVRRPVRAEGHESGPGAASLAATAQLPQVRQ